MKTFRFLFTLFGSLMLLSFPSWGQVELENPRLILDFPGSNLPTPQDLTYHPVRDTFFVVTREPGEVYELSRQGALLNSFSISDLTNTPQGIDYDWVTGALLVSKGGEKVFVIDADGTVLSNPLFELDPERDAEGIAVHPLTGNIFLADKIEREILEIDRAGNILGGFSTSEFGIDEPQGIGFLGTDLLIADDLNSTATLYVFSTGGRWKQVLTRTEDIGVEDAEGVVTIAFEEVCVSGDSDGTLVCADLVNTVASPSPFELTEGQVVPPSGSTNQALCTSELDPLEEALTISCNHNVTDPQSATLRRGGFGEEGPVVFNFMAGATTTFGATINGVLEECDFRDLLEHLKEGNLYVEVTSATNPEGDIRGQVPVPPHRLYFAQFGGGGDLTSDLVFLNQSTTSWLAGVARFDAPLGGPLSLTLEGEEGSGVVTPGEGTSELSFFLNPLQSLTVSTSGSGPLRVGSVEALTSSSSDGIVRFTVPSTGIVGVGVGTPLRRGVIPVRRDGSIRTGVAIRNNSDELRTLTLTLRRSNGAPVANGMVEVDLEGNGQTARFVEELFGSETIVDGFRGTLLIEIDGGSFSAIALEQGSSQGEFTTLPVAPAVD